MPGISSPPLMMTMLDSTTSHDGLSETQASQGLAENGPNQLPASRPRSILRPLREILTEPMFLLLAACGAVYLLLGDRGEALIQRNRGWSRGVWRKAEGINHQIVRIALVTVILLLSVLLVPALAGLFVFVLPPAWSLLAGLGVVGLYLQWFERVKK